MGSTNTVLMPALKQAWAAFRAAEGWEAVVLIRHATDRAKEISGAALTAFATAVRNAAKKLREQLLAAGDNPAAVAAANTAVCDDMIAALVVAGLKPPTISAPATSEIPVVVSDCVDPVSVATATSDVPPASLETTASAPASGTAGLEPSSSEEQPGITIRRPETRQTRRFIKRPLS